MSGNEIIAAADDGIAEKGSLDTRTYDKLEAALKLAKHTVYKQYLNELSSYPLIEPGQLLLDEEPQKCIRAFQLTQLTCKKGEDIFQKLSTVYHAAMSLGCSVFVVVDTPSNHAPADIYLGIHNPAGVQNRLLTSYHALLNGLLSNFPGTQVDAAVQTREKLSGIINEELRYVSAVSCVASARDKSKTEHKSFVQGLEKLIDVMRGRAYTAIFIADPVSAQRQSEIRSGYENLYSTLSSFRKSVWSYHESESHTVMERLSQRIPETIIMDASQTQSHAVSDVEANKGISPAQMLEKLSQTAVSSASAAVDAIEKTAQIPVVGEQVSEKASMLIGKAAGTAVSLIASPMVGAFVEKTVSIGLSSGVSGTIFRAGISGLGTVMQSFSATQNVTSTIARSIGLETAANLPEVQNNEMAAVNGAAEAEGSPVLSSRTETNGTTDAQGSGRTLQIENVNKSIEEMLKRIDAQLKRVQEGEDYGAYNCGAYFLSGKQDSCLLAANTYRALMLGEGSSVESGAVNTWSDPETVRHMKEYLRRFAQPVFAMPLDRDMENCMAYSPGTIVSGLELPLHLGLPTKSVIGLPVIDHAEFGRNTAAVSPALRLGELFHMGQPELGTYVQLDPQSLAAHTFMTGSAGSGKTNAVFHMLDALGAQDIRFLIIEPTKGIYKELLGQRPDVHVYGTNMKGPMLRLDPFSFPENIHVLEHIDRLAEVFSACWPMCAAMPVLLKDAIEEVYLRKGWDLSDPASQSGEFPTFRDLGMVLPEIMERSACFAGGKNDDHGALVTRVKLLAGGINGQIFCSPGGLSDEELFDRNVLIDISRVGSMETRSLLMGLLVMKLQEYRLSGGERHAALHHVTVLEEAHHLLRRTSDAQTQNCVNLQAEAIEMIADAIDEMRTYGEGFLIVDQSPGLIDRSVIRNTGTKVILRLSDGADRELVGKAISLNEGQMMELAKLPRGVAAVYQNEWPEPVLCMFDKFTGNQSVSPMPENPPACNGLLSGAAARELQQDAGRRAP